MTAPPPHRARPRGAAGIAMIILMVVLQLAIVGVVVTGARDQDAFLQRLDATRALYASEAGMNMAIRELTTNIDQDGDGAIGTISNDGNAANDPLFTTARVSVTKTASGANTILTCTGRAGSARVAMRNTFIPGSDATFPRRIVYCDWPNSNPQTRIWNGASWSAAANTTPLTSKPFWALGRRCPRRTEMLTAYSVNGNSLEVSILSGSTWSPAQIFAADMGTVTTRPFSVAYEYSSGDGLIAYRSGNSPTIFYRTWNGAAWSAQLSVASPLAGNPTYIKLVPKAGGDEIVLYVLDSNNDLAAMVWNGTAWGSPILLETNAASNSCECVDAAYETTSGRCMVMWGQAGNNNPVCRIWNGSAWGALAGAPSVGAPPLWIRLAPDKVSNRLMMGCLDGGNDINVNVWSGVVWGTDVEVETSASISTSRAFDVAFEGAGTAGLVVWAGSTSTPHYRVFDGTSWGSTQNTPAVSGTPTIVQLSPDSAGATVLALFTTSGGQTSLDFLRFTGTTFDSYKQIENNISGGSPGEFSMISDRPIGVSTTAGLNNFAQVAPQ